MQGVYPFFSVSSAQDMKNATEVIAYVDQGGIGLPERDYYFKDDPKSVELRKQYVAHVQKMFELLGDKPDVAATKAKTVMTIETALAKGSLDVTSRRDPEKVYHRMPVKQLAEMNPSVAWDKYLPAIGSSGEDTQCRGAGILQAVGDADQRSQPGRLEGVPDLARGPQRGSDSAVSFRE